MTRPRSILLIAALLTILCGTLWIVSHGNNQIAITGMPSDGMTLAVIDTDDDHLSGRSFPIKDGLVDLGWGYSIKGCRILVRISDDAGTHYEGDLVVDPHGTTRLYIPRPRS